MPDGACSVLQSKTMRPQSVRTAYARDEASLFELALEAHEDNGIFGKSDAKIRAWCAESVRHDGVHFTGVIDGPDGRLDGYIATVLTQPWYSDDWFVEDRSLYVRRDQRCSGYAGDLIQFAKWYAESLGLPFVFALQPKKRWEDKTRFFARYLPQSGSVFLHDGRA